MDIAFLLGLLFRWLHILAAIVAVGGTAFARFVVVPTLNEWPAEERARLHAALRARWSKIIQAAIGFLLVSGLYNIAVTSIKYTVPAWYNPLFGVKFLLAMIIFAVASLLIGKTPLADQVRRSAPFWLNLNIALAVLVVCISGILRTADKVPKQPVQAEMPVSGPATP